MYLPSADTTGHDPDLGGLYSALFGSSPSVGGWSSTIGVVTAICGNVLISFALNTQRYAHMRLGRAREQAAQQEKRKAKRRKVSSSSSHPGYGATEQQKQIADGRAELNATPETNGHAPNVREEAEEEPGDATQSSETQPLIPKVNGRKPSRSSEDTAREDENSEEKDDGGSKEKSYLRSPIWWLGIALMVIGEAGNFLAYGFAPASIVSPLGVVALVSNCLIAPLVLGEKFRWRDGFGVLVATAGCVVVVLSASASNPKLTPDAIWRLISKWEFETYFGITVVLIVILAVASNKIGEKSILIDLGLVGLFGGYTALSTKGVASLLSNTIWRVVTFPITYLLVAVLVFTAVMQIKYVNRALQRFNATMVIPTQFVLFTLSVIIGSAVLYRDFEREETGDAIKFCCGCALTFFGVWCITSGRGKESQQDDDEADEEEAIDLVDEEHSMPEIHQRHDPLDQHPPYALPSLTGPAGPKRTLTTSALTQSVDPIAEAATSPPAGGLLGFNDASAIRERLSHMSPANASTVHSNPGPLTTNPSVNIPPPLHATTSAPVIPTAPSLSSSFRPKTPLDRTPSGPATDSPSKIIPSTPRGNSVTLLEPVTPTPQQRLLNRHSVVGLFPGPLTSPLSGSLSAIVADEIRRNSIRRKSGKSQSRPRIATALTSQPHTHISSDQHYHRGIPKRHSIASVDFETEGAAAQFRRDATSGALSGGGNVSAVNEGRGGARGSTIGFGGGRMRSLSATLGEIFGSTTRVARRTETENSAEEVEPDDRGRTRGPGREGAS